MLQLGCLDTGSDRCPPGSNRNPIDVADGATVMGVPLAFSRTDALPSVSNSLGAVSVGIV